MRAGGRGGGSTLRQSGIPKKETAEPQQLKVWCNSTYCIYYGVGEICKLFQSLPPDYTFLDILKHTLKHAHP